MARELLLEMNGISKSFPGVVALDGVDLTLNRSEVLGLVGQNGAGKSTLIKILDGVHRPDSGEILFDGNPVELRDPAAAFRLGIRVIHQELSTFDSLTVAENLYAGEMVTRGTPKRVDWKSIYAGSYEVLQEFGIDIDARAPMSDLSISQKQLVEIAKAVHKQARCIVMDEPTSALGEKDTRVLFDLIRKLRDTGISIIYISHHLDEVFEITDRVMVLRDGRNVGTLITREANRDQLITLMVGRTVTEMYPKTKIPLGEVVLELKDFALEGAFSDVHLSVRRGEILGIFGLLGCGKDEILGSIYGITGRPNGEMRLNGDVVAVRSPAQATVCHIGFAPIDRKKDGVALSMKVKENIVLANIRGLGRSIFINRALFAEKARKWVESLNIKTPGINTEVESLSGGNQQKVVLAKCLESAAQIVLMNEPTRGVDVGAKVEIYGIMEEICRNGGSIVMISSDIPEIMSLADRVMVVSKGVVTAELQVGQYTQDQLLHAANL